MIRSQATRTDVARLAGVSTATVSHVVNQKAGVTEGLRRRVEEAIQTLGYRPNPTARSLKTRETRHLALLSTDFRNPYYAEMACAVEDAARARGYLVSALTSSLDGDALTQVLRHPFDGFILQSATITSPSINRLASLGVPLVLVEGNQSLEGIDPQVGRVPIAIREGAVELFRYLVRLGHRRIGYLALQDEAAAAGDERLMAYRQVLAESGWAEPRELMKWGCADPASAFQAVTEVLQSPDRPTALFAGNDFHAQAALAAAAQLGIRVPHECSVVGFDNLATSQYSVPRLTTVDIPKAELGVRAVEAVLALMEGRPAPSEAIRTRLVLRDSAGPPFRA